MKLLGIFDYVVALAILCGGCYLPKKWQQGAAFLLFLGMAFVGSVTILESFV